MTDAAEFQYLAEKILAAPLASSPFPHLYIENFLSDAHFDSLTFQEQIKLPRQRSTEKLISRLMSYGWEIQSFPGCTTSIEEYLRCFNSKDWPVDRRIEGFGLAFRLGKYEFELARNLVSYLNSAHFKQALEEKFSITRPNRIDTAIQKYLSGYEISPHPDIRSKCLTYLVNINTDPRAEEIPIHTHLLKFRDNRKFIYDFWKYNEAFDTDWVPWEWCETVREVPRNNSLLMFAPSWNTLHAVKLQYDHLEFQRTQIYGNLWYNDVPFLKPKIEYDQFDLKPRPEQPGRE